MCSYYLYKYLVLEMEILKTYFLYFSCHVILCLNIVFIYFTNVILNNDNHSLLLQAAMIKENR